MSKLYLPGKIGKLEIRNRLVMTPMHLAYCQEGRVSDRIIEFYRLRARGGVGLIVTGAVGIDPVRVNQHEMLQIYDDVFIPGLCRLTEAVHAEGAKIFPQLFHPGRYARTKEYGGLEAIAPSAVPSRFTGETPREMNTAEIAEIVAFFAAAADRAKRAGFDGVEIVGSAGYLIAQFLSALTNKRQDRYGGDLAGRMTFALEVVAAVRQAVGPDFPIMVRVAGHDFMSGGNTNCEAKQFAVALESAGVDAINVTGGWHETHVPQLTMEVPAGAFSYLGRAIKESVAIPVVVCNRMNAQLAEQIVDEGNADFVGIARGFVADPDLAKKAECGAYGTIRPCVACNQGCMDNIFFGKKLNCLVNREAGREAELFNDAVAPEINELSGPERILVIGAGVAGMEYARVAAGRGHRVTIWEASSEPGGQVRIAAVPPGRQEFMKFVDYLLQTCHDLKVEINYGKQATKDNVLTAMENGKFDRLIIATGAIALAPPFEVEDSAKVVPAWEVLKGNLSVGDRVVVIGGGAVGVETALALAKIGTIDAETLKFLVLSQAEKPEELYRLLTQGSKEVTLLEMDKGFGRDMGPSTRWSMLAKLKQFKVNTFDQAKVARVKKDGVVANRPEGQVFIPADTIVVALGSRSNDELYSKLKGKIDKIAVIGDAQQPRKIQDAVRDAYDEASRLECLN
ncbi:MAG: NADH:flavin oxidoreductase/NADH oxidase [Firmicutes bacterium]|nr:NADH:flavin oxidoreductase/NADH oxidase [Bacillota bacterium]